MNEHQKISRKGGKSGRGAAKARISEQASAAAQARWAKHSLRVEKTVSRHPPCGGESQANRLAPEPISEMPNRE
jgi:hypothetical protein